MKPEDQANFPPSEVQLRDGSKACLRLLRRDDGPALGDFYESIPREDFRFYCPHELTRARAMENAAAALHPHQVVLVLEAPGGRIAGYAWYRWKDEAAPHSDFGICLRREFQHVGAGRVLTARLLEIARTVGPPTIALTVQHANPKAVALYRSMGFEIVREQIRVANEKYGLTAEPEYFMERRVR